MSKAADKVKVSVLRHHTFRGKEYNPGDSYLVDGDESQTAAQYVDTLRGTRLAIPADEDGPNIVEEVSGVDDGVNAAPQAKGDTRVKALGVPEPAGDAIADAPAPNVLKPLPAKKAVARKSALGAKKAKAK